MKGWFPALLMACLLASPGSAYADGGFIPSTAFASVKIPDQEALIHFANGTETLVIETAFKGDGTNFAWIVPVPSSPKVEAATTGLFTTLRTIFQPRVIHDTNHYYKAALIIGAFGFFIIRRRRTGDAWLAILAFCFFLFLMGGLLLPALGTAGVGVSADGVNVIERKTVGIYETATISSRDGEALLSWLAQNGFATPTNFVPVIRAYAQEGWFFVASKIRLNLPLTEPAKPHPLAFTFKTERPVYPLRLTGIGNEKTRIDLYVFGPDQAVVQNFVVERCASPAYPTEQQGISFKTLNTMRIRHPLLREIVGDAPAATKLTAELTSQQMEKDGYLTWTPWHEQRLTLYTKEPRNNNLSN